MFIEITALFFAFKISLLIQDTEKGMSIAHFSKRKKKEIWVSLSVENISWGIEKRCSSCNIKVALIFWPLKLCNTKPITTSDVSPLEKIYFLFECESLDKAGSYLCDYPLKASTLISKRLQNMLGTFSNKCKSHLDIYWCE